jgi:hypothetical protein
VGKHEVKGTFGNRSGWKDIMKKNFAKIGVRGVDWNILAQNTERCAAVKTIIKPLFISVEKCAS